MSDLTTGATTFVAVERGQLRRLIAVAERLYTERRMNGDEMRDLGHTITAVLDQAIDLPDDSAARPSGSPP